jgi:hypothetical protein
MRKRRDVSALPEVDLRSPGQRALRMPRPLFDGDSID